MINPEDIKAGLVLGHADAALLRDALKRAEAAEAKLEELAKQEPVAYEVQLCWDKNGTEKSGTIEFRKTPPSPDESHGLKILPLFTNPVPAADLAELVPVITRLKRRYVCNEGSEFEFIACVTPERSSIGTGQVWDDWRELSAILRNIEEHSK